MGEMRRAIARDERRLVRDKYAGALTIAAAVIAAVRLSRYRDGEHESYVVQIVRQSVGLAWLILETVLR